MTAAREGVADFLEPGARVEATWLGFAAHRRQSHFRRSEAVSESTFTQVESLTITDAGHVFADDGVDVDRLTTSRNDRIRRDDRGPNWVQASNDTLANAWEPLDLRHTAR